MAGQGQAIEIIGDIPETDDPEWQKYLHSQRWRIEPKISHARQKQLDEWRNNKAHQMEKYPFGGQKLTRADVEYLLATHNNGQGPVDWNNSSARQSL